jgi:nicotinamidase-related amidase
VLNIQLLIIDPQNDFCDPNGSLYVPGADEDMTRLSKAVVRLGNKLTDIHVTLDSHRILDISHPLWWKDSAGNPPPPFTTITAADMRAGKWTTSLPGAFTRTLEYLDELEKRGRYPHVIWPEHCKIGDWGQCVFPVLAEAIHGWERAHKAMTGFVTKGSNPWTEHFSGVEAEVPDPEDPSTQLNGDLIATLKEADVILLAGEARSHCLANTLRDILRAFKDPELARKLVLLTDACSDVPGFESFGDTLITQVTAAGVRTATTVDFLA